jgi:hypothetical protein
MNGAETRSWSYENRLRYHCPREKPARKWRSQALGVWYPEGQTILAVAPCHSTRVQDFRISLQEIAHISAAGDVADAPV